MKNEYFELSYERISDLPLSDQLRLFTYWIRALLPYARVEISALRVEGRGAATIQEALCRT